MNLWKLTWYKKSAVIAAVSPSKAKELFFANLAETLSLRISEIECKQIGVAASNLKTEQIILNG